MGPWRRSGLGYGPGSGCVCEIGFCRGKEWAEGIKALMLDYGYELTADERPEAMLEAMKMDKKKKGGKLRYILPAGPQDIRIEFLEPEFVLDSSETRLLTV